MQHIWKTTAEILQKNLVLKLYSGQWVTKYETDSELEVIDITYRLVTDQSSISLAD